MSKAVTRHEFVRRLMGTGMTYSVANRAYETFIRTIEDAVVTGTRVNFGRLGALKPTRHKSRSVHMGFQRQGNKMVKASRTYFLGQRIKYRFHIYDKFSRTHELRWTSAS